MKTGRGGAGRWTRQRGYAFFVFFIEGREIVTIVVHVMHHRASDGNSFLMTFVLVVVVERRVGNRKMGMDNMEGFIF